MYFLITSEWFLYVGSSIMGLGWIGSWFVGPFGGPEQNVTRVNLQKLNTNKIK